MLYLVARILGATVMPHNLYLHSGCADRRFGDGVSRNGRELAIKLCNP